MSLFSKFFKKSKLNQEVLCLVNLEDSIIMPPNSFLTTLKIKNFVNNIIKNIKEFYLTKNNIKYSFKINRN